MGIKLSDWIGLSLFQGTGLAATVPLKAATSCHLLLRYPSYPGRPGRTPSCFCPLISPQIGISDHHTLDSCVTQCVPHLNWILYTCTANLIWQIYCHGSNFLQTLRVQSKSLTWSWLLLLLFFDIILFAIYFLNLEYFVFIASSLSNFSFS